MMFGSESNLVLHLQVGFALSLLAAASAASGQAPGLFTEVEPESVPRFAVTAAASTAAITVRQRLVTIDFAMLDRVRDRAGVPGAPATLQLNLFRDQTWEAVVTNTEPTFSGGYSLTGRIGERAFGGMVLVVNGAAVAGTVRTPRGTFRIRPAGAGRYAISEVNEAKLPASEMEASSGPPARPLR